MVLQLRQFLQIEKNIFDIILFSKKYNLKHPKNAFGIHESVILEDYVDHFKNVHLLKLMGNI